jgi:CubicO group peptidase (beta-lactamase class C family)
VRRAQPASPRHAGWQVAYSSDGSHLLSAIVADSTGQPTLRYAQAKLFGPLGIASDHPFTPVFAPRNQAAYQRAGFAWPTDPQGYQLGYGFLRLTARDLARFGYLYLKGGNWQGRQVVPAAYVRAATQPHVATGSRAAVATAFQPTRRRIQAAVDRRFNRRRYDAARTIQAFNARLRDKVDLDMLAAELLSVIDQTMEPTRVSFWLRPPL